MANIANGVFKQLIYAKEQANQIGVLQSVTGEGLTSPVSTISLKAAVTIGATISDTNIAVNGFLIVGQQMTIGNDTYTVATVTQNLGGVSTAFTLAPVAVRTYATTVAVKLIQSAEASNGGSLLSTGATPTQGQTFTPVTFPIGDFNLAGSVGTNTLTAGGTKAAAATIALGQKLTFAGDATVYSVTSSIGTLVGTSSITVFPNLLSGKTATTVVTFIAGETAKYLRRVSSNLDLKKATFKSNEIRTDMQRAILAVGANSVDGTISGELSNKTYADFMASVVRREFAAPSAALTLVGVATPSGMTVGGTTLVLTAATSVSAASNASNLIKVGDVVSCPFAGSLAAYANFNFIVTGITGTVLTLELLVDTFTTVVTAAEAAGLVFSLRGKKTFVPKTGHLKNSFQIEHFFSDVSLSELFIGCRPTQLALKLSPSAMSTVDFTFMGQDMKVNNNTPTPVLASIPQAAGNDAVVSANTGALYLKDSTTGALEKVGLVTAFDATVNGNGTVAQVVGSTITPDVFLGAIDVTGNMSIYFTSPLYRDSFFNQSDVSIIAVFRSDSSPTGNFISVVIPKARITTATKDDGEKGLILTTPYSALVYDQSVGGTYFEETTIQIQDSAL
jgi:hypothetical protein